MTVIAFLSMLEGVLKMYSKVKRHHVTRVIN